MSHHRTSPDERTSPVREPLYARHRSPHDDHRTMYRRGGGAGYRREEEHSRYRGDSPGFERRDNYSTNFPEEQRYGNGRRYRSKLDDSWDDLPKGGGHERLPAGRDDDQDYERSYDSRHRGYDVGGRDIDGGSSAFGGGRGGGFDEGRGRYDEERFSRGGYERRGRVGGFGNDREGNRGRSRGGYSNERGGGYDNGRYDNDRGCGEEPRGFGNDRSDTGVRVGSRGNALSSERGEDGRGYGTERGYDNGGDFAYNDRSAARDARPRNSSRQRDDCEEVQYNRRGGPPCRRYDDNGADEVRRDDNQSPYGRRYNDGCPRQQESVGSYQNENNDRWAGYGSNNEARSNNNATYSSCYAAGNGGDGGGIDCSGGAGDGYNANGAGDQDSFHQLIQSLANTRFDTSGKLIEFARDFYVAHPAVKAMSLPDANEVRKQRSIHIVYPKDLELVPNPVLSFEQASFPESLTKKLLEKFRSPTPIQVQGWPIALSGHNVVGIAQTGSGKTLAFILPALVHIHAQPYVDPGQGPVVLVLAPTRELAEQIGVEATEFGVGMSKRVATIYGQMENHTQTIRQLRQGVDLLVACPGKLMDFLKKGIVNLRRVTYFVLDEADRLLDMGFEGQIVAINAAIRPDRQLLMWSATWPKEVDDLLDKVLPSRTRAFHLQIGDTGKAVDKIIQKFVLINEYEKSEAFFQHMIDEGCNNLTLVFCNTKQEVESLVAAAPSKTGKRVFATKLHGGLEQSERKAVGFEGELEMI